MQGDIVGSTPTRSTDQTFSIQLAKVNLMEKDIVKELREHADSFNSGSLPGNDPPAWPDLYRDAAGVIEVLRSDPAPNIETIVWLDPSQDLPDEDETVLLYAPEASEPVWPGFKLEGTWFWADGKPVRETVVAYAEMPAGKKS